MNFTTFYADFISGFLPTVTAGVSRLLSTLGQTLGDMAVSLGFEASIIPVGVRDITLFSAILGAGISVVILYTLVKWVLGVLG